MKASRTYLSIYKRLSFRFCIGGIFIQPVSQPASWLGISVLKCNGDVFPQCSTTGYTGRWRCCLFRSVSLFNQFWYDGKKVVFLKHSPSGFFDMRESNFILIVINCFGYCSFRLLVVMYINGNKALRREVISCIWASSVERQASSQKCVGKFFRPMM